LPPDADAIIGGDQRLRGISFDQRMAAQDIAGVAQAHAAQCWLHKTSIK